MVDYSIDGDFDHHKPEWKELATVDGYEEFRQDLVIEIHRRQRKILDSTGNTQTKKARIRLAVTRAASKFGVIDDIDEININRTRGTSGRFEVEVRYEIGDSFTIQI